MIPKEPRERPAEPRAQVTALLPNQTTFRQGGKQI